MRTTAIFNFRHLVRPQNYPRIPSFATRHLTYTPESDSQTYFKNKAARRRLLEEVYAPFQRLQKGSKEFEELARSGRVWEEFFQPSDSDKLGYTAAQKMASTTLEEIDAYKALLKVPVATIARSLVAEYAHQSVQIEGNRLALGTSMKIHDYLTENLFNNLDLATAPVQNLLSLEVPELPDTPRSDQVIELTNHIVLSRWVSELASASPGSAGLDETQVQLMSAMALKGTASELLYTHGWGKRVALGGYRSIPISVRSNPLEIFPYHDEVPSLMKRFFEWRDRVHQEKKFHPLVAACQMVGFFTHIHPFPDGNGRVSRIIMQDYMIRQGYLPIVMQNLRRENYLELIAEAHAGRAEEFVAQVLQTQLDEVRTFYWRQLEDRIQAKT